MEGIGEMTDTATVTKVLCADCEEPLTDEEIESPSEYGDGPVCCTCEYENYFWSCEFCEEYQSNEYDIELFAVFDEDAGVPIGVYRILETPYCSSWMIGRNHIYERCVKRIGDLPEGAKQELAPCALLCEPCAKKYLEKLEGAIQ